ncbi:MAG: type II secretion system F family protein [Acidobacteria bacterium]|nr:type II secretion system F family protein [Acidobacteriota bacterium]
MAHYICRLATEEGKVVSQAFFAPSVQECRRHYEEQGLCVLSVKRDWKKIRIPVVPFEKKIKDKDFILFNQEFVALVKAGYPVLKSIEIISQRVKNVYLKDLLLQVEKEIRGGKSLSEAFLPFEKEFSKVYIASLMAGEKSGNLPDTINRYIDYAKVIAETKSKIRAALTYPTLLFTFALLLIGILVNFILPRFADFYASFQEDLPGITKALINFSLFARSNILFILGFLLILFLGYLRLSRNLDGQVFVDRLKLRIPYGRSIWLESAVSLFCRTLSLLLGGGISLIASLGIAIQAIPNRYLIRCLADMPGYVQNGESLSGALGRTVDFPPLAFDMIRIGESSANLEGLLSDVAEVFESRIRAKIDKFVSLIEPLIIIVMGLIVAAMLLSVYVPIFNIIRVTR